MSEPRPQGGIAGRPPAPARSSELRCECGSLLARRTGDRIELKCRRCKRVVGVAILVSGDGGSCTCD